METFHRFTDFPPEIRELIFLFATPPRVVIVEARLDCSQSEIKDMLWTFSPHSAVLAQREKANGLKHFHSNTTIPVLLHTCSESRAALMRQGYQLTFGSPSTEPRTWFNYDRDVFLPFCSKRNLSEMPSPWDVVQLEPGDMKRLRKLACGRSAILLYWTYPSPTENNPSNWHIMSPIPLYWMIENCEALEEVFLVDWTTESLDIVEGKGRPAKRHRYDVQHLLKCVDVEPFSLLRTLSADPRCGVYVNPYGGSFEPRMGEGVLRNPAPGLADWGTFDTRRKVLEAELVRIRNRMVSRDAVDPMWKPPRITAVHLLDACQEKKMHEKQAQALRKLARLRQRWADALQERKARLDAGLDYRSMKRAEVRYLFGFGLSWEERCWIEKDLFS